MKAASHHLIIHRPLERAPTVPMETVGAALAANIARWGGLLRGSDLLHEEPHPALAIDFEDFNPDLVAFGEFVVRANG